MTNDKILDVAHVIFLEMIEGYIKNLGPASAKGTLMRFAMKTAEAFPETEFDSMDDFADAIETLRNPIAQIEGRAVHKGDGLFGLPACPFAESIGNFKALYNKLPESYGTLTDEYNRPGPVAKKNRVGHGAGVSPFCAIHQPLRSALGARIKIGGKALAVYQLGCKAGDGKLGFADDFIDATGHSKEAVEAVLADNMCCYAVVPEA